MTESRFTQKADEFVHNKNYDIIFGKAYEILTATGLLYGATHLKERIFHKDTYYENVYRIAEEKIRAGYPSNLQPSRLENISNNTYQRQDRA